MAWSSRVWLSEFQPSHPSRLEEDKRVWIGRDGTVDRVSAYDLRAPNTKIRLQFRYRGSVPWQTAKVIFTPPGDVLIGEAYFDACCPSMLVFVGTLLDEAFFSGAVAWSRTKRSVESRLSSECPRFPSIPKSHDSNIPCKLRSSSLAEPHEVFDPLLSPLLLLYPMPQHGQASCQSVQESAEFNIGGALQPLRTRFLQG